MTNYLDNEKLWRTKQKMPKELWNAAKGAAHGQGITIIEWVIRAIHHELEREKVEQHN